MSTALALSRGAATAAMKPPHVAGLHERRRTRFAGALRPTPTTASHQNDDGSARIAARQACSSSFGLPAPPSRPILALMSLMASLGFTPYRSRPTSFSMSSTMPIGFRSFSPSGPT